MKEFSYRQLLFVREVARAGSLAEAAKNLHLSVSSVREGVANVEARIGKILFLRTRAKGVELTPEGRRFLDLAEPVFQAHSTFERRTMGIADPQEQELELAIIANAGPVAAAELVGELTSRLKVRRIKFAELNSREMVDAIRERRYPLGLSFNDFLHPSLTFEEFFATRIHVALSRDHPLASRKSLQLGEIIDEPYIFQNFGGAARYYGGLFDRHGLRPNIRFVVESAHMARQLVVQGVGYSTFNMAPHSGEAKQDESSFVRIPIETDYWSPTFGMFYHENYLTPSVEVIRQTAKAIWQTPG